MITSTSFADSRAASLLVLPSVVYLVLLLNPQYESEQAEIELKEDNPHAVEARLRYIYGCKNEHYGHKTWQYCLDLFETDDKYLEPELSSEAGYAFKWSALRLQETDVEEICEVLQNLQDWWTNMGPSRTSRLI